MKDTEVRLEDAAEILGEPIEGSDRRNHVVCKRVGNGNRIEVRRFYLFDPRGVEMRLYQEDGRRPFMKARAFSRERLRHVVDWFSYLADRPDGMRSETRLARISDDFSRRSSDALIRRRSSG